MSILNEIYRPTVAKPVLDEAVNVVLAYCIAAMFLIKNTKEGAIEATHFLQLLEYVIAGRDSVDFTSEELSSETYDLISLRAPMSDTVRGFIMDELVSDMFYIVETIIAFLNADTNFNNFVERVTNNGVLNRVIIDTTHMSASDPTMTSILVDNQYIKLFNNIVPVFDIKISGGGIGQKDLIKDYGYDAHRNFFKNTLGLDIGSDFEVYYEHCHNNGSPTVESIEGATRKLYEAVCRRLNDGLNGVYDTPMHDFKHALIANIFRCCYGVSNEHDCSCLVLPKNGIDYQSFNVKDLYERIYYSKLSAICPENVNPSIRIIADKKELFQIRFKKEKYQDNIAGHRYKMYLKPTRVSEYFKK